MELNLEKNIFCVKESVFRAVQEVSVDSDINLPDYCTDIAKILKCTVMPEITSKALGSKRITIDGTVKLNLIYCDTSGRIKAYSTISPYTKNFETDKEIEDGTLCVEIFNERVSARPLSPRKADLHATFDISAEVFMKKDISVVSGADDSGIETEESEFVAEGFVCSAEKLIVLDELIDIGQSKPAVKEILRYDIVPVISETKIISNKVIIKGEATVKILYSTEEEECNLEEIEITYPLSQIIDLAGTDEECICFSSIKLVASSVKEKNDVAGDCRAISLEIVLEAEVECRKSVILPIVTDAYSTECEMESEKEEYNFIFVGDRISDTEIYKKNIELPAGEISAIESMWCKATVQSVSCKDKTVTVCGVITASILGKDDGGMPFFAERPIDFEYTYNAENSGDNISARVSACVKNCGYTLKGGNCVEVRAELEITGEVISNSRRSVITNMKLLEDKKIDKSSICGLTVYFACEGECVWNIAKKYATAKKKIMADNNLECDILKKPGMLLISSK